MAVLAATMLAAARSCAPATMAPPHKTQPKKKKSYKYCHFITKRIQVLLYFHANSNGLVAALQQYITNTKYPNLYSYSSHDLKNE